MFIAPLSTEADVDAARALFASYAASLPIDLAYQGFAQEVAGLPGRYAPPGGQLFLARDSAGTALGCVALRALADTGSCEMKRLFLTPQARGAGLGRALVLTAISAARDLGYRRIVLDTLPHMAPAKALYARLGFKPVDPYYEPTPAGTVFMALDL